MKPIIKSIFIILLSISFTKSIAQTTLTIKSKDDGNSVCNVVIDCFVTGQNKHHYFTTDVNGKAAISIAPPFILKIHSLGFIDYTDTISKANTSQIIYLSTDSKALNDVVITAQYGAGMADKSTYKVKIIDAKKIQDMGAVNLRDALSNELNFRFSQDNALGQSSLSLQGISGENVKILIDGVPLIGRQNGNVDLTQINVNTIERIEIVEGPLSVNFGTNALAGVINIITKKPKKNRVAAGLQTYYETNNTYNSTATFGFQKKVFGIKIDVGRNFFYGWNFEEPFNLIPQEKIADKNRNKQWKPRVQSFSNLGLSYQKKNLQLNYSSSFFNETILSRGLPLKPYYEVAFDDYFKTQRFDNSLSTQLKLSNYKSFNNIIAYNNYKRIKNTYYTNLTNLNQQLSADASAQDTSRFTMTMMRGSFISAMPYQTYKDTQGRINRLSYELGYDLNLESAYGKRIKNKTQYISDLAFFISTELQPVKDLVFRLGLRYAKNSVYNAPLTPSFNLKYNKKRWLIRASYARGFRAPSLKELYFDFVDINHNIVGSTNLKAELSHNFTASYKFKTGPAARQFTLDHGFFYNDISNLITLGLVSGTNYSYINIGKYITYGSSINIGYTYKNISTSGGFAYTYRYNNLSENYEGIDKFLGNPEGRASVNYNFKKRKTSVNIYYKYTGKLPGFGVSADNVPYQTVIDAYHTLDANVSGKFFKQKLVASLGLKNIFNVQNVTSNFVSSGAHSSGSSSMPVAMGRTLFIKLDYAIN